MFPLRARSGGCRAGNRSTAAAPAIAATSRAPLPSKPAAAPASTAGMSLDDLIRHEVQKETAKHR